MSDAELVLRLLVAAALGAIVGLERQLADEPAGLRTHLLVAMGAALFGLVSVTVPGESTRIAAQVVTGVGFLGAAAIIRSGVVVRGIATAASLWVVAAIGLATAFGHWTGALVAAAVAVVVLRAGKRLEVDLLRRWRTRRAELVLGFEPGQDVDAAVRRVSATGMLVRNVECSDGVDGRWATLHLEVPAHLSPDTAADAARAVAQVRALTWSV
jgi:putative Mg2+ transporter-C (MgtC) family protein